ncbi:MAG: hypothetical protein U0132_20495 [Gemmatimonadaceae bacterium]
MSIPRFLVLVALAAAAPLAAQQPLQVHGPGGRTVAVTRDQIASLPGETLKFAPHHGDSLAYHAVRLTDVLRTAGFPVDSMRVGRQAWVVMGEASDGYVVAFAAAELDPKLGPSRVWLAYDVGGHALEPTEGPYRLIVPTDARPTRSARQLVALRVVDALAH